MQSCAGESNDWPQIACASYRLLGEYCYRNGLNPRQVRWLHELRHLNGLRGKVILVETSHDFPWGFLALLRQRHADGLVEIEDGFLP